jgi:hypothetical protein
VSDASDRCDEFLCQKYFFSIFLSQILSTQKLFSILFVSYPFRISSSTRSVSQIIPGKRYNSTWSDIVL